eukprot:14831878-Alexandrium_andersonii.AAC.1
MCIRDRPCSQHQTKRVVQATDTSTAMPKLSTSHQNVACVMLATGMLSNIAKDVLTRAIQQL